MRSTLHTPTSSVLGAALFMMSGLASSEQFYRIFDLAPGEGSTRVDAINAKGQAAGIVNTHFGDPPEEPYIWFKGNKIELGTLGGESMTVSDISNLGHVTGYGAPTGTFPEHAFVWDGLVLHDLGTLGGQYSGGVDVNTSGHVTGYAVNTAGSTRAFLWDGVSMKDLGTLGGDYSEGAAINAKGQVAGTATTTSASRAFLWDGTKMNDLGTLGGENSAATGINAAGEVIGVSETTAGDTHAFMWDGTTMKDLGSFIDTENSTATAINASGQVTGESPSLNGAEHPFLWDGTTLRDLGSLRGRHGFAEAINSAGQVVGYSLMHNGVPHAFVSNDGNPMVDLNDVIDRSDPLQDCVRLRIAVDINDRGLIAANGSDSCVGKEGAYLAQPMDYMPALNSPANASSWSRTSAIPIKFALVDANGVRISDALASSLIAPPCKVKFSATGAQPRSPVCMKYDAVANRFFFNWKPGATANTGATTLKVAATYKFSMLETITTFKTRAITITQ